MVQAYTSGYFNSDTNGTMKRYLEEKAAEYTKLRSDPSINKNIQKMRTK